MWPLPVTKDGSILCTLRHPPRFPLPYSGHGVLSISCSLPTQVPSPIPSQAQLSFFLAKEGWVTQTFMETNF